MMITAINIVWCGIGFWCGVLTVLIIAKKSYQEDYRPGMLREGLTKSGVKIKRSPSPPRPVRSPPSQRRLQEGYQPKMPEGHKGKGSGKPPQGGSGYRKTK